MNENIEKIVLVTRMEIDNYPDEWTSVWGLCKKDNKKKYGNDIILIHGANKNYLCIYNAIEAEKLDYAKIIIGIHVGGGKDTADIRKELENNKITDNNFLNSVVAYSLGNTPSDEFTKIVNDLKSSNTYNDARKRLLAFLNKKKANYLSLKHKIAHLFLSIDMDLQGIAEVKKREDKKESVQGGSDEYLKAVLKDIKDNAYYTKILADLQFMIIGKKPENGITGNIKKNNLHEQNPILDLIKDKKDTNKDKCELMKLCGLVERNSIIALNENSIICKFMEMMDKKISKNNIGKKDVNAILEFFKNSKNKIQGIESFHDWFCALDNCLDKIRAAIK